MTRALPLSGGKVESVVADLRSFINWHGDKPRRIRMHPDDVAKLQDELVTEHGAMSFDDPARKPPPDDPDYVMTFLGVPLYRKWDAVMGRPWMDL